ncbi:Bug family tripartite tricarboxylate transporter substrate binding protein [Bordetella genomosp. 4]|uniref:ABC transporter substrate-binding protein n=1 Tax=Bordetella genomosp. 4 TaxID=463044 RepID=A0A261UAB3_9BORD|nr:tripartite tricarboxylate transporter substrate binding protein [Bordetella genomosp. 4]OZI58200.1 hypothetical protein CAL20_07760 [Bordetella genomosp. 4]
MHSRIRRAACLLAAGLLWTQMAAAAQTGDWPTQTIRIIVPSPPGGAYDATIRPVARSLSQTLQQPVVIENKASGGNIIGTQAGARAAPDGYTLTMTGMVNTISAGIYDNLTFDINEDFTHIGSIGAGPQWLVVRADAGIGSLQALIEQARQSPGKINYASSGVGSTAHLLMESLQRTAGISLTHVPYKGGAPALQDVLGGVVPAIVVPPNTAIPYVKQGTLKVLAISSAERDPALPDVPTFKELNYPQLTVSAWVGLSAPKGTPIEIVNKINAAIATAMQDPELKSQLIALGMVPMTMSPAQYAELVRSDTERWGQLTHSLNIKAN